MTKLTLGGNMPASNVANGLPDLTDDLVRDQTQTVLALCEIRVNYAKTHPGDTEPDTLVLQLTHVEPVQATHPMHDDVDRLFDRVFTQRTGENARPSRNVDKGDTPLDMPEADGDGVGL